MEGSGVTREEAVEIETGSGTGSGTGEGLERASVTTFLIPGMCTIGQVALLSGGPMWRNPEKGKW